MRVPKRISTDLFELCLFYGFTTWLTIVFVLACTFNHFSQATKRFLQSCGNWKLLIKIHKREFNVYFTAFSTQSLFKYLFPWTRFHSVGFLESFYYINCQTVENHFSLSCPDLIWNATQPPFYGLATPISHLVPRDSSHPFPILLLSPLKINKEVFLIIIQSCQYTIISPLLFTLILTYFLLPLCQYWLLLWSASKVYNIHFS